MELQAQAFGYLRKLDSGDYTKADLIEMQQFLLKKLCCKAPEGFQAAGDALAKYPHSKLNRPIRVCGMVRNVGEPGGGPFLAYNPDGTVSLQILDRSQIDTSDPEQTAMF